MVQWIVNLVIAAFGLCAKMRGATKTPQEKLGQAEAAAQSQENARAEVSQAVDARRAADAQRLREQGAGPVTVDPVAPINSDDGFRRD